MKKDVVIIGGGPSGLSAALYLARAGLKPLVLAGDPPGGQLMLTTDVENFPGNASIPGPELVSKIRDQAISFGTEVVDTNVKKIVTHEGQHAIETAHKGMENIEAKAVLVATGAKAVWMGLESETRLRGRGVSACATCDGFFFRNKKVAIIGGGDSALEEAIFLTKFASHVVIIHRRGSFRASKIMQERVLKHEKISVIWNATVKEVLGESKVEGVLLVENGEEKKVDLDGVFVAIGHKPDTAFVKDILLVDSKGYILTKSQMAERLFIKDPEIELVRPKLEALREGQFFASETSSRGIFAAGDCVDRVYRQASTAAGLGVGASLDIEKYLESLN